MITKTYGSGTRQVTMELSAGCGWPMEADVYVQQLWVHDGKREYRYIDIQLDEAEQLLVELQAAIAECKKQKAEYDQYMKENPELP